jgi:uncharacterized membrane protein
MNYPHIHLLLNHIPVLIPLFALPVLLWGIIKKQQQFTRLAYIAFVVAALVTAPVFHSGEEAEDVIELIAPDSKSFIHAHEDAAEWARISVIVTGLFSIVGLFLSLRKNSNPAWLMYAILALALSTTGTMAWTALTGGEIRHTEIRADADTLSNLDRVDRDDD